MKLWRCDVELCEANNFMKYNLSCDLNVTRFLARPSPSSSAPITMWICDVMANGYVKYLFWSVCISVRFISPFC